MEVEMSIQVIHAEVRSFELFELSGHLLTQLRAGGGGEKIFHSGADGGVSEQAVVGNESRDSFGRQGCAAAAERKMKADAELWVFTREFNRRLKKRLDELGIAVPFPRQNISLVGRSGTDYPSRAEPGHRELREDPSEVDMTTPAAGVR